jgi:hypothetical protein
LFGGGRVDTLPLAVVPLAASMGAVLLLCGLGKISICQCEPTRLRVITHWQRLRMLGHAGRSG